LRPAARCLVLPCKYALYSQLYLDAIFSCQRTEGGAEAPPVIYWMRWTRLECSRVAARALRLGADSLPSSSLAGCPVGQGRLELPTSRLSGVRSNHLSYWPLGASDRMDHNTQIATGGCRLRPGRAHHRSPESPLPDREPVGPRPLETESYVCSPSPTLVPARLAPGTRGSDRCRSRCCRSKRGNSLERR
jgi:hypothetical protein